MAFRFFGTRAALLRLLLGIVAAMPIAGCGAPGAMHSALPATVAQAQAGASVDPQRALDASVAQAHAEVAGTVAYGTIDGVWVTPMPAPGKAGFYIIDGETLPGPPEDVPPAVRAEPQITVPGGSPLAAAAPSCDKFAGNVPPPCTDTGEFRRVFSAPGYSFALAHLTLPAETMQSVSGSNGDIGYAYMEGWSATNPDAGNSEFGFQYSPAHQYYTPYIRTDAPKKFYIYVQSVTKKPVHYLPSSVVTFAFAGYTIAPQNYMHVAVSGTTDVACAIAGSKTTTHACLGHGHVPDNDWSPAGCCIMARMTTVGQTNPDDAFYDGANFGPIVWSGVELAKTAPAPAPGSTTLPLTAKEPAWTTAGMQNWPPKQSKVVAQNVSPDGETDTIDLAKLPELNMALNPAADQTVRPGATVKYNLKVSGATAGLTLLYGWYVDNLLKVPGVVLNVPGAKAQGNGFLGPGKAATLNVGPSQGPYSLLLQTFLYFEDAAGKNVNLVTAPWDQNGGFVTPAAYVHVGLKK